MEELKVSLSPRRKASKSKERIVMGIVGLNCLCCVCTQNDDVCNPLSNVVCSRFAPADKNVLMLIWWGKGRKA